jgi:hypothetical protein
MTTSTLQGPAPAKPTPRPKPFKAQGLAYSVVRGPNDAGAWYWRARGPDGAVAWTGWASRDELLRTYRVVEPAPQQRFETVKDLLTAWLDARANDPQLSPNSHRSYTFRVHNLIDAVGPDPVESLGNETLDRVHAALLGRGLSPKSVQLHQRALVCATRWAARGGAPRAPRVVCATSPRARPGGPPPHTHRG